MTDLFQQTVNAYWDHRYRHQEPEPDVMTVDQRLYGLRLRQLHTAELKRRYERLEADTSAMTCDEECARMFHVQQLAEVLAERNAL